MTINANTKISALLKNHPDALDAIVSITPKFEKLRNPLLRKLMAGRTSIAMASKISGCPIQDFFDRLAPLGFQADAAVAEEVAKLHEVSSFLHRVPADQIITLDVRPVIADGKDPLKDIMKAVKSTPRGGALKIVNSFEPTPLISLLEKQGYNSFVDHAEDDVVETWFFKEEGVNEVQFEPETQEEGFDEKLNEFGQMLSDVDVRQLPMPIPMHTILEKLDTLPDEQALFVYHKRIPVFLLPELKERGFDYRIKELNEGEVRLLIYKEK